ncbi:MAG TPA: acyltransferase [Candidatus Dojkabacteria bacterium]|nr:acyltransferase [Candidatus Dojkabacteria bacterium]
MDRSYYPEVDKMKAFAALLVILTHILANYKGDSSIYNFIWEVIHFSVGAFVFASGFLFGTADPAVNGVKDFFLQLWKKVRRIVIPYWSYAFLYVVFMILVGQGGVLLEKMDWAYFLNTVFLLGGVGYTWIPRLFLMLMFTVLVLNWISKRNYHAHVALLIISIFFSSVTLFIDVEIAKKFNMLFGWYLIFISGFFLAKDYTSLNLRWLAIISTVGTAVLAGFLWLSGLSLSIFHNEYPPTPFFVLFNVAVVSWLWLWFRRIRMNKVWHSATRWLAHHSYEIFFYHLLVLYVIFDGIRVNPVFDFVLVTFVTIMLIYAMKGMKLFLWALLPKKYI